MKNYFLLLIACCSVAALAAQPLAGSSTLEQLIVAAELAEEQKNWNFALDQYELAYEKDDEATELLAKMAMLQYKIRDFSSAERSYNRIFRKIEPTDTTFNEHRFRYGRILKMNEKYDDAIIQLQDYLRHATDENKRQLAQLEITGAELAQNTNMETEEVELKSAGRNVNKSWSEYSPALTADGQVLYFSTWESNEVLVPTDPNDPVNFSRIFMSTKKEGRRGKDPEWGKAEALGEEVNRPGAHTANPAISRDGRRLYYNRIVIEGNEASKSELYVSDVEDTGWKSGNPVEGINGDYLVLQPAVGELFGEEVLFFVSDMPGGEGGLDIYYAPYRGDNSFGDPVNLGPSINTIGDEVTPFYFDGTLYFASTGYPTFGGKDIFYSVWNGSNWSDPENMGPGFNTSLDDQSFKLYGDGFVGFLTSNRKGGRSVKSKTCCDDIYEFQIARITADLVVGLFTEDRKGLVGGNVRLISLTSGETDRQQKDKGNRFDYSLVLENDFLVVADHPKYYPDTFAFNTLALEESTTVEHRFFLKARPVPPPKPVYDTIIGKKPIVLENLLYDFNKANIRDDAEPDLITLKSFMDTFPDMVIELGSHTDARGKPNYNLGLSKRRADSARRWLIARGIAPNRVKTKGYGMTKPQVVNDRIVELYDWLPLGQELNEAYINGLSSEEEKEIAHQLNRRTEFQIIAGPTEFIYKREIFERKQTANDRQSLPKPAAAPSHSATLKSKKTQQSPTNDSIKVSQMSSLYGQKDITGLPILAFEHRKYDLGVVKKGDKRSFSYTFTNKGKVAAQIMLIQACDCTTTEHDNTTIYQPGESGTIEVVFDSSDKDEAETITIDIFLEQVDKNDVPIVEVLEYDFDIE
ncbi:MAG: OmpA family protein [Bacteroidota bacterium]